MRIYVDGIDRIGKSTFVAIFNAATGFRYNIFDRSPLSSIVYDKTIRKKDREETLHENEIVIVVTCDEIEDIKQRFIDTSHEYDEDLLREQNEMFKELAEKFEDNVILVNYKQLLFPKVIEAIVLQKMKEMETNETKR